MFRLLIFIIIVAIIIHLWSINPAYGIVVLIVGLFLFLSAFRPKTCQICGSQIKRVYYKWEISGWKKRVCPKCNQELSRRKSKHAVDNLFK
jgi:hypothetical protein